MALPKPPGVAMEVAPYGLSGTVYGTLLNHRSALAALGDAVSAPPHNAPPRAPVLYVKPRNTLAANGAPVAVPSGVVELEIGACLGLVIGRSATRVAEAQALSYLAGYLIVNDVSVPHAYYRPAIRHKASLSHVTSGRSTLASKGVKVALHHPILGVGVGGFRRAYAEVAHLKGKEPKAAASHTTPITVAAETGVPGLVLLLWLVATALVLAFRRLANDFDGAVRLVLGLALVAILVHCIFYNALFEDPTFWGLLALIAVGSRTVEAQPA